MEAPAEDMEVVVFPVAISGRFQFIPFFDPQDLLAVELFRIPTRSERNVRVVQVCDPRGSERQVVAVSPLGRPFDVVLLDVGTKTAVLTLTGHTSEVWGLAHISLPSPRLISGGRRVYVFDAVSGERLCELDPNRSEPTRRIMSVPEWAQEVYVTRNDEEGRLVRTDLNGGTSVDEFRGGHLGSIRGLASNVQKNVLYSASLDETVKIWDRHSTTWVETLQLGSPGFSLYCAEDKNLLIVGSRGVAQVWDIRQTARRLLEVVLGGNRLLNWIQDIDRIDENHFVSGSLGGEVAIFNALGEDEVRRRTLPGGLESMVRGVCQLRPGFSPLSQRGSVETPTKRIEVLVRTNSLTLSLQGTDTESVVVSRCLLGMCPILFDSDVRFVDQEVVSLSTSEILSVLVGESPAQEHLDVFYRLFSALRMDRHVSVVCKHVERLKELDTLVRLARSCFPDRSVEGPEEEEGELVSSFAEAVIRGLKRHVVGVKDGSDFVGSLHRRLPPLCSVLLGQDESSSVLPDNDDSFPSLFLETTKSLFHTRRDANVTLRTLFDGGEEQAHVEVLVLRNNMFYQMLKFEGKERGDLMSSRSVTLEEFTHPELCALLEWIYTAELSQSTSTDLHLLFHLVIHGTMYHETGLLASVRLAISDFVAKKTATDVCLLLLETGFLMTSMPAEFSDWFFDRVEIRADVAKGLVEGSCRFRDVAARLAEVSGELESLRRSQQNDAFR